MTVAQVQDFSRGVPVFRVPVAIKIVTAQGATTTTVWLKEKGESFEFPSETKPLLVRFDEGNVLIKEESFPRDLDELLYKLKRDDMIGRMGAAGELLKFKDEARVIPALAASAKADPFWAVRKASLESLAKLAGAGAAPALTLACQDPNSAVRTSAVLALGGLKDRSLVGFYKDIFRKDGSVRVRAEALRALGQTGDASLVPFLRESAAVLSHQNAIRRAAEAAVKMLEKK
jgi:aminopeptidase N